MSSRLDSWEYLSKCLQMSCRYQTSRVATFRLYLIPLRLRFAAESINPPFLCSFLPSFHLWITSPNPNSRKFTETHRGHVRIDRAARGSRTAADCSFFFFLVVVQRRLLYGNT